MQPDGAVRVQNALGHSGRARRVAQRGGSPLIDIRQLGERVGGVDVVGRHDHHDVLAAEIDTEQRGPAGEPSDVTRRVGEKIVEQLAADPLFGLGHGPLAEQQQGRHLGRALQRSAVDVRDGAVPGPGDEAENLLTGEHSGNQAPDLSGGRARRPGVVDGHGAPRRAGLVERR